jgi:hypothetical protein
MSETRFIHNVLLRSKEHKVNVINVLIDPGVLFLCPFPPPYIKGGGRGKGGIKKFDKHETSHKNSYDATVKKII